MIDNTDERSKSLEVSSCEQVQTTSMIYDTEGRMSSEYLNVVYSLGSKSSGSSVSDDNAVHH